ncbi:MAG: carboxypeptidase-like regulatory domain-containing protein, partial [Mucilaginibacter sp.]
MLRIFHSRQVTIVSCFCLVLLTLNVAAQQTDTLKKSKDTSKTSADTGHKAALQPLLATRVTGQVLDAATGKPLSYVNVNFNGSGNGANTDSLGKFDLIAEG